MIINKILNNKIIPTVFTAILVGIHVIWDYYNNGVPTHYILAREDLPGISNWWGIITIPLLTWILIFLVDRRIKKISKKQLKIQNELSLIVKRFLVALCFGIVLSILWETNQENILQYMIYTPLILSLFFKQHLPENLLGFVLGMIYTFGGILPIGIGLILMIMSFIIYNTIRAVIMYSYSKLNS